MKKLLVTAMSATLLLSACGGSSSGPQGEVADLLIESASGEGLKLDEGCVRDKADKLSDDDAQAIVDAGPDGDPELSDAADAVSDEIFECVDADSYLDTLVESISSDGETDADCLRDELRGLSVDEMNDKVFDAAFACITE